MTLRWNGTDSFTSFVTYIFLTIGMNLIGQMKILTDYGWFETRMKFWIAHFPNFTILLKIWLLAKLLFSLKGGWFSNSTYQRNASVSASKFLKTLSLDWLHVWHEIILGEGQRAHGTAHDSDRTDEEDKRAWPQIIHGQFLFFPWIIWWFGEETVLLLWYCQAEQERHATRPKTEDNKTENGRHSR